jgi:hypothetical protein
VEDVFGVHMPAMPTFNNAKLRIESFDVSSARICEFGGGVSRIFGRNAIIFCESMPTL